MLRLTGKSTPYPMEEGTQQLKELKKAARLVRRAADEFGPCRMAEVAQETRDLAASLRELVDPQRRAERKQGLQDRDEWIANALEGGAAQGHRYAKHEP